MRLRSLPRTLAYPVIALVLACAPREARADSDRQVTLSILKPRFEPGANRELGVRALQSLADYFEQEGYRLREVKHTSAALPEELRECQDARCAAQAARVLKGDITLYFTLFRSAEQHSVSVVLFDADAHWFEESEPITPARTPEDAALDAFVRALAKLRRGAGPVVMVGGEPQGADVFINGDRVGVVPYVGRLEPGRSAIVVRSDGYEPFEQEIEAGAGTEREHRIAVRLEKVGAVAPVPEPLEAYTDETHSEPSALNFIAGSVLAAGAAGLLAYGIVSVATAGCTSRDAAERCEQEKEISGLVPAAFVGAGVLAVGASVLFIVQPFVSTGSGERAAGVRVSTTF